MDTGVTTIGNKAIQSDVYPHYCGYTPELAEYLQCGYKRVM